jgi:histidinol-phosphate aminotransferase
LAGLRLGVLVGDEEQMKAMRRVASPYNVNAIALACLPAALADQEYVAEYVSEVLEGLRRLEAFLHASGISFWTSEANFILMRVGPSKADAAKFVAKMRDRGILVRDRSGDPGCEGCVRITLGLREQVDRLLDAMPEALEVLGASQGARS